MSNPELTFSTGPANRLVVQRWDTPTGRSMVALVPQYRDRRGQWRLAHSAVALPPIEAGGVAEAIVMVADEIQSGLPDAVAPREAEGGRSNR